MIVEGNRPYIITEMDRNPHSVFHLTGSRFFTPYEVTPNTDWDFFTENTEQTREWLLNNRFTLFQKQKYPDDLFFQDVFQKVIHHTHVDVQMLPDDKTVLAKRKAQDFLYISSLYRLVRDSGNREAMAYLWAITMRGYYESNPIRRR